MRILGENLFEGKFGFMGYKNVGLSTFNQFAPDDYSVNIMEIAYCIACGKEVRARQHAIACDTCELWQHRVCGTRISLQDYRKMVRGELEIDWVCERCTVPAGQPVPVGQSSMIEEPGNISRRQSEIPAQDVSAIFAYVQTSFNDLTPLPDESATLQAAATDGSLTVDSVESTPSDPNQSVSIHADPIPVEPNPAASIQDEPTPVEPNPAESTFDDTFDDDTAPVQAVLNQSEQSNHVPMGGAEDLMEESDQEMETETVVEGAPVQTAPEVGPVEMEVEVTPVERTPPVEPTAADLESSDDEIELSMMEDIPDPAHESIRIDRVAHPINPRRLSNKARIVVEPMAETLLPDQPATYYIIPGGSVRGGDLLSDDCGYTYSKRRETSKSITWACSSRGKKCPVTLRQMGEKYIKGAHTHNHGADPDRTIRVKTRAMVSVT